MHSRREYSACRFCIVQCNKQPRPSPMSSESAVTAAETPAANGHGEAHSTAGFKALMLGSIGVVYGDIGTSPLYALREAVVAASGGCGRRHAAGRARRALADPVGADRRGDAEIRRHPAARRQQRRGRNAGADGAGATRGHQGRRARSCCSASSPARCSTATRSSRRRCRCCRRSKASSSSPRPSNLMSCR